MPRPGGYAIWSSQEGRAIEADNILRGISLNDEDVVVGAGIKYVRTCTERGMVSLRGDGLKKAASGATSVEEILRATEATI